MILLRSVFHQSVLLGVRRPQIYYAGIRSSNQRLQSTAGNGDSSGSSSKIRWYWIPASLGFCVIAYIQTKNIWRRNHRRQDPSSDATTTTADEQSGFRLTPLQVQFLRQLPTRLFSRIWGKLCDCHVPVWMRKPVYNSYSYMFSCDLTEASVDDVTQFETINDFFSRKLKPEMRLADQNHLMISPADCTVLSMGAVSSDLTLEQIKGISYPLLTFLGPKHPFIRYSSRILRDDGKFPAQPSCVSDSDEKDYEMFYCSLYLGPGDYHGFHAPTDWTVEHRRHVPGDLFSVNPRVLRSIAGLFNFNERVLLFGRWQHGPMLFAAVGAYNVGSIQLNFRHDQDFVTNIRPPKNKPSKEYYDKLYGIGVPVKRFDPIGQFKLGSSIVLLFIAPKDFSFVVRPGDKLKVGEPLGTCPPAQLENNCVDQIER